MGITRRAFMKSGAMAAVGTAAIPSFLTRAAWGAVSPGASNKRLVVIFQRGAADGLNIVVPHAEPAYYAMRPSINIPRQQVIDLNGFFGLHPAMAPLKPLWEQRQLAIVHAAGSPDTTRSHFDAQDYMESGTPGVKATDDGWLNRTMQTLPEPAATPFRAVALGPNLPRMLHGSAPAVALPDVKQFQVLAGGAGSQMIQGGFEAMYAQTVDTALRGTGTETFEAIDMLKKANPAQFQPENGADYPKNRYGQSIQQVAQLLKANIGLEVAFLDTGGWDNHVNEGGVPGQLANFLRG